MKKIFVCFLFLSSILSAQTPFSTDSALSYLKTLSVDIGPRPFGSPNERRAMEFGLKKFREFDLATTYVLSIRSVDGTGYRPAYNTNSGVVVGILPGSSSRIILIGGHIDSASPFVPGANDDASGAATVIELARILSKQKHEYTLMFCLWGGEEAGLCGSNAFVKHDPHIDSVALMLQVDMANGSEWLMPMFDVHTHSAPRWLVQAAYEEFFKLGYTGLRYPTNFFAENYALPLGEISSDHEPFLQKGIPAIDFTSNPLDPIHTQQDDLEHFKPSGLKRSGDLVYNLVQRFDAGVPQEKLGNYFLIQFGHIPVFIPFHILYVFIALSIFIALFTAFQTRKRRTELDWQQSPKHPVAKLLLIAIIVQACVWLSENIIGWIKGVRYPWISFPEGYFLLGLFSALIGIVVSLYLTPKLKLSHDPYRWYLRSAGWLAAFIVLFSFSGIKLATYPATALLLISFAMLVRKPWLKFIFWILSPHFMFHLAFSEGFTLFSRTLALNTLVSNRLSVVFHILYIVVFALYSFSFLLGFAAMYFDSGIDLLWLKRWRSVKGIIAVSSLFFICLIALYFVPSYSDSWRQTIGVEEFVDGTSGNGTVTLKSNEYMKDARVCFDNKDSIITNDDREILLKRFPTNPQSVWLQENRTMTVMHHDSMTTFDMVIHLHSKYRPHILNIEFSAGGHLVEEVSTPYTSTISGHTVAIRWETFPDTALTIPIHFTVVRGDSVLETTEANYIELMEPVTVQKQWTNVVPQTIIRTTSVLK
ncbi:MAG TPA: M28 family peptidase [Bacteroidota bacterium]|nr:M28 family peptidase [Bacteroidota bacterium]